MKRVELSKKGKSSKDDKNPLNGILCGNSLYYSGFCLTDNMNFAFFYANTKFFVDNIPDKGLNRFKLTEVDLNIIFDRENQLSVSKGIKEVSFNSIGCVDRAIFNTMKKVYPDCVFHPVTSFFGQNVNSLIFVLREENGKPVGLLKAH